MSMPEPEQLKRGKKFQKIVQEDFVVKSIDIGFTLDNRGIIQKADNQRCALTMYI
jgi:hypothetical protein